MRKDVLFFSKRLFFSTACSVALVFLLLFITSVPAYSEVIQTAVVTVADSNHTSGAHSVVSVDPVGGPRSVWNDILPTLSDLTLSTYGEYFYRIGRYQMDHVAKFNINAPDTPVWQFSVLDPEDETANPYDMIFVSANKAYLIRYNTTKVWIVNPSAATGAEFKIGEIDVSSYGDEGDGIPEMSSGLIRNGKLFITFQRLDRSDNWALNEAWIGVFDTETDTEINTGKGNEKMMGIPLPAMNPHSIQYVKENNTIYVQCAGNLMKPEYTGGIVSVNPDTYETAMILDDGDDDNHPYGNISGMSVISSDKGYFVSYAGWKDNNLYSFNPSTGNVIGPVNDYFDGKDIAGMEQGARLDKNGMLWVCNSTDTEIVVINPADNTIDEKISMNLNPKKIIFVTTIQDPQNEWVKIKGRVQSGETPICAMVLANGEHMFSCGEDGNYELDVPLDSSGEITLHASAEGFAPYKQVLYPWEAKDFNINMRPESSSDRNLILTSTVTATDSEWMRISGKVMYGETPICAIVLANGEHTFSCDGDGEYELEVPLNSEGEIDLFGFAEGFAPFKETL